MFSNVLKLLALYYINNRISDVSNHFRDCKEDLSDYAESRALFIKNNLLQDLERMGNTFFGFLSVSVAFIFSGLIGLMWLFAVAWNSEYREIILAAAMIIPLFTGAILYRKTVMSWQNKPFMHDSTNLVSEDWNKFRYGIEGPEDEEAELGK